MAKITRQQLLDCLQNNYQNYAGRFYRLSPQAQKAFLVKQGYANLAGLFGHMIAWWQDALISIQNLRADPAFTTLHYNVDAFNARAIEKFGSLDEDAVVRLYEVQRQGMFDLVSSLTDAELENEQINARLNNEIIGHWGEHPLD